MDGDNDNEQTSEESKPPVSKTSLPKSTTSAPLPILSTIRGPNVSHTSQDRKSSSSLLASRKSSSSKKVVLSDSVETVPIDDEDCDDVLKSLVKTKKQLAQDEEQAEEEYDQDYRKLQHDENCPLYEDDKKKVESDELKPCPPGVRRCCTCGVCPLDLLEGEDKDKSGKEKVKHGDASQRTGPKVYGTSSGSSYWTDTDVYGTWDSEDWGRLGSKGSMIGASGDEFHSPMSDRSRHEGSFIHDYMKFFIEPLGVCYKTLSSLTSSYVSCEDTGLQRTIVIVKPEAVPFKEAIYRVIFEAGFQILGIRVLHLTPEQVSEIYSKYYGSPSFVHMVVSVSDSPVLAICISAMNAIKRWLQIIGPDGSLRAEWFYPLSMRKLFGLNDTHPDWIYGSENLKDSNKENRYFYPKSIIEPIVQDIEKVTDYCSLTMNKTIVEACAEVVKKRPADPIIFLADYLLLHNPFQPRLPKSIALTPT